MAVGGGSGGGRGKKHKAVVVTIISLGAADEDAGTKAHDARGCGLLIIVCRCIDAGLHSSDSETNWVRMRSVRASPQGRH